ncbi:ribosomal RNA small subunit methyltransferase A [Helicobacter muridarum]|uniref:Dimethyladenosine transferase n=1 Tax=Helicobacter muridarum TaxID=216 RepID=A0A377PSV0_9HELI|nr:16S rRNA (adenine(1518)-N(6)/adenine(1519)-N(6))-dimethyltransferase RsmA [Helicobacter muridarum]TLE01075.1 ribosomal RNA small subunit methyltransferase A [Helicobacter muridarum]STQ85926.1 dimethyladenosine transferase [Helicobacter muridarum]
MQNLASNLSSNCYTLYIQDKISQMLGNVIFISGIARDIVNRSSSFAKLASIEAYKLSKIFHINETNKVQIKGAKINKNSFQKAKFSKAKSNKILAKKNLGQNFLSDITIMEKIIQAIPSNIAESIVKGQMRLIEVGIGLGDLTKRFALEYPLLCYEIDKRLIDLAKDSLADELLANRITIEHADALHIRCGDGYLFNSPYFLVSNLPYYIATTIILQTFRDSLCQGFVVMTQEEVARKFCAKTSNKEFCALSVIAEILGKVEYLFCVSPESFTPRPKVNSAVFRFMRERNALPEYLESTLKHAFLSPRKRLFSNLATWDFLGRDGAQYIFDRLNFTEMIRAHEVSSKEYCKITQLIAALKKDRK